MKQLFFYLIFFWPYFAKSQSGIIGDNKNLTIEAYDLNGKRIPSGDEVEPEGSKMLLDQYVKGTVRLKGSSGTVNLMINLSLTDNQLLFKKDSTVLAFATDVDSFSVPVTHSGKREQMNFKAGFPSAGANNSNTLYQVLQDGQRVQLLKFVYKVAEELYSYGGPIRKEFTTKNKLYIYDKKNGTITEITTAGKAVKKSLPDYSPVVDNFLLQKKIKTEQDVASLVSVINEQ